MDIETVPHAMYFTGNTDTVTKINQIPYQTIQYNENGIFTTKLMNDTPIKIFIDNGATPSILPLCTYNKFPILHTYPKTESNTPIHMGGGMITSHFWLEIPLKLQHQTIQIKALVWDSECPYDLILGRTSMAQLSAWQDYMTNKLYIQQILIPLTLRNNVRILPGKTGIVTLTLQPNKTSFMPRHTIMGKGIAYIKPLDQTLPLRPIEIEFENNHCCMEVHNTSDSTVEFLYGQEMAYFDARSKGLVQINNSKHFPIDQYLHDRMRPATLSPSPLAYEKPIHPAKMSCNATRTEIQIDNTNKSTSDDKYPWFDPDDPRRNMTDKEVLQMKLNLKDSILNEKGKEEFLMKVEQFTDVFSLRDEIGTCPFIEVHLKLKDKTPFFVRPYPMREEQKKVIQKEMDRLEHLGIICKGLTSYSSLVVLVKWKNQNLYQVCSDFHILNEKINHAFPLVRDCIEQLGRKKCHYLSTIDLRDTFHTLTLALSSQKYCGITPYYGSPTYHYVCMGMGMSVSPQIWQQFVDLVFQDDPIKRKQNFDVIMDDTFIHSTAEEHMDDLIDLFKVLRKYGLKLSPHKCQFFKKMIVYMGLEFQIQEDKVCYTPLKDQCDAIQNLESPKTLRQTRAFCGMVNFLSSFLPNLCRLLIPIYDLQKKAKKFKWTEEAERAFNDIKKLLISPPVLKAPSPDGLFCLGSNTSREGTGGTLLQKQRDEWVVIGYHSKRLPKSAKNFSVTELELTGLLVNIHGFMQLLRNRYFEVLVDHKAIEYMIKSKTESPMTRLKTLLLKLSKYTIDLKYQKGSEMHTSDALSRLHNFTDTPDQKDVISLNFLQHFTPHYTEHLYSHLVENLYAHKTKTLDTIPFKRKHGRPPKPKS